MGKQWRLTILALINLEYASQHIKAMPIFSHIISPNFCVFTLHQGIHETPIMDEKE